MRTASLGFVVFSLLVAGSLHAMPMQGTLNFTGAVSVSTQSADFLPPGLAPGTIFLDSFTQTGSFAPFGGTTGAIVDLSAPTVLPGVPSLVNSFVTLAASPSTQLNLTSVAPGVFGSAQLFVPPAPGQTATPVGLPGLLPMYNMVNLSATSSLFSFSVAGNVVNGPDVTPFTGVFTLQFPTQSYQQVLQTTLVNGGSVNTSFSATLVAVPEPATLLLLTTTLLAARGRRQRQP